MKMLSLILQKMNKYIDADKLTKVIEDKGLDCSFALKMERLDILAIIDELKQEQPQVADASKMEQPVDGLEEEIIRYLRDEYSSDDEPLVSEIARHFYELGLNARKEDK